MQVSLFQKTGPNRDNQKSPSLRILQDRKKVDKALNVCKLFICFQENKA